VHPPTALVYVSTKPGPGLLDGLKGLAAPGCYVSGALQEAFAGIFTPVLST